jgi:hypothetical protein
LAYSHAKGSIQPKSTYSELDIREAQLCIREHRCDRREAEIRAARMRGMDMGSESGSE